MAEAWCTHYGTTASHTHTHSTTSLRLSYCVSTWQHVCVFQATLTGYIDIPVSLRAPLCILWELKPFSLSLCFPLYTEHQTYHIALSPLEHSESTQTPITVHRYMDRYVDLATHLVICQLIDCLNFTATWLQITQLTGSHIGWTLGALCYSMYSEFTVDKKMCNIKLRVTFRWSNDVLLLSR